MKIVALIPLRSGSKGIKNKNIRQMCGKPLFCWAMEAAIGSSCIDEVWISTESNSYVSMVKEYYDGVNVHKRPKCLASDTATTDSVITHFSGIIDYDIIVTLQVTNPFTRSCDIDNAIEYMIDNGYDSIVTTVPLNKFVWPTPINKSSAYPINYDIFKRPRRQEGVNPAHIENGAFYITKRKIVDEYGNRLGGRMGLYDMPAISSTEIDILADWGLVEQLLNVHLERFNA